MLATLIVSCAISTGTMEVLPVPDGEAIPASQLGTFDIIVANILARPILRLQPVFARFVKPGTRRKQLATSN